MKSSRRQRRTDAWKAAEDYGCDMSLIERNLKLTPAERIRAHSQALNLVFTLGKAKEAMDRPRDRQTVLQLRAIKRRQGKRKR
jgi:hypothetical protein